MTTKTVLLRSNNQVNTATGVVHRTDKSIDVVVAIEKARDALMVAGSATYDSGFVDIFGIGSAALRNAANFPDRRSTN
jgi:hypothetical protein